MNFSKNIKTTLFLLAVIGITLSTISALTIYEANEKTITSEFHKDVDERAASLYRGLSINFEALRSLAILFREGTTPDRKIFSHEAKKILSRYSDIQTLEWIPRVLHSDRVSFEAKIQQTFPSFEINEQKSQRLMVIAEERKEYYPVNYIEPLSGNEAALGFDLASSFKRLETLTNSRDTGKPLATTNIKLVHKHENQKFMLVFLPIYGGNPSYITEYRESIKGFIHGDFRVSDIFNSSALTEKALGIEMRLIDETVASAHNVLHIHKSRAGISAFEKITYRKELPGIWGQKLVLVASPTLAYVSNRRDALSMVIFIFGIAFTFFVTFYIYVTSRRSSEHKQAKEELKQSETKFRSLVEGSLQGIFVHKDFKPLFANQKCADIFGYHDPEEILKLDSILESFISPQEHERLLSYTTRRLNGEPDIPVVYECLGIHKDGNQFWFQNHVSIIDWYGEKAILATAIDITERKKKEQELFKSHTLYNQAEHLGKLGYWEWDVEQDGIINCSEEYANIFNMTVKEVINLYPNVNSSDVFGRYIHEDDFERYTQITELAYERKESWDIEFRVLSEKGEIHVHEIGEPIIDESGAVIRTFGTLQDITVRKQTEEQLSYQASHDALTGLINRYEFERRAERLLSTTRRDEDKHALCYLDLDQFKVVNDTCGHVAGDEMLRQLSTVLQNTVRHRDTLARLGGDEFGVLMEHCSLDNAHRVAKSLLNAIHDYLFLWEEYSFKVGVSIGLVPITTSITNLTELLKDADAACYMAKDKGRNRIHIYHADDTEIAQRHGEMQWVTRIQDALDEGRFCLYAQAIVPLDNSSGKHYELLIRMINDKGNTIPPGAFLPAAERYNLMTKIDYWVIENTFNLLAENRAFQNQISFISINLSGQSLADQNVLDFIITQLNESGIEGEKICFEITETTAISNLSIAMKYISTLRGLGCRFALDDFGSGLSSFGYLKNLPVDYLKIDGMFVKDIVDDRIDHAMVKSINEIGQVMGMQTIAEFVENDIIRGMLREIGVNYAQGYGIHKPQPFDELLGRSNNVTDINKSIDG